jgi:microcystin-dependent protein
MLAAGHGDETIYHDTPPAANIRAMASNSISGGGAGLSHNNMQPFLALNYIIALQGLFPSRN